jgi:hypothetical protein
MEGVPPASLPAFVVLPTVATGKEDHGHPVRDGR